MNKNLACALILGLVCGAHAAPIAGKIAIGTWSTQAEFTDIKVYKGASLLYSSALLGRNYNETFVSGTWDKFRGIFRQTGTAAPAIATIGYTNWTDYTITLKAQKTGGNEGFLIGFGMPDNYTQSWLNIGGWGNTLTALQVPGCPLLQIPGSVQNNHWYQIKIDIQGSDIRCYMDGVKLFDTMRLFDWDEMNARRAQVLNSPGMASLPGWEQDQVRNLFSRDIYLGRAARETYNAMPSSATFSALSALNQAKIVRDINRHRMTWKTGWGFGSDAWRDATIIQSMDDAVSLHNSMGVFDKDLTANNSPGTQTADANFDGQIRFGGSLNYRVALHEISHTLGTGTYWMYQNLMYDGFWHGTYANLQLQQIVNDPNAVLYGDSAHYWPYGLNYDSELGPGDDVRHVKIVAGFVRDMGLNGVKDSMYSTIVPDGVYRLTPRLAPNSAVEATSDLNGSPVDIRTYTGTPNQKFQLELQSDGTYVVRSTLPSARSLDLPNGVTDNGAQIQVWDSTGNDPQRWYVIPMGDGWFKIAPKNNVWKTLDLWNVSSADGTPVKLYDFWDGFGQQFRLDPA